MKRIAAFVCCAALNLPVLAAGMNPAETVDAFHKSLQTGERAAAIALLAPQATILEQGFSEASRDAYAAGHLSEDVEFARATQREVLGSEASTSGDVAWVQSLTRTRGKFSNKAVDVAGAETMILRRDADAWKIVHIHWSAHNTPPAPAAKQK